MLPILKMRQQQQNPGLIVKTRAPDEKPDQDEPEDKSAAIHACAAELISCIHAHDIKGAAEALKDAFEILESMPHEESEADPHSYDAQNEKAAK